MRKWRMSGLALVIVAGLCLAQAAPQPSKNVSQQQAPDESVFSDVVANEALSLIRDGLEAHSPSRMLSAFDRDKMEGYGTFADQVRAFFDRYEAFRVLYRITQTTVEGARGVALVDFEIEETPRGNAPPQRKNAQIRFELERGRKGWKIVDLQPRAFFS